MQHVGRPHQTVMTLCYTSIQGCSDRYALHTEVAGVCKPLAAVVKVIPGRSPLETPPREPSFSGVSSAALSGGHVIHRLPEP